MVAIKLMVSADIFRGVTEGVRDCEAHRADEPLLYHSAADGNHVFLPITRSCADSVELVPAL